MNTWLPVGFEPPSGTTVPFGHRLRPVRLSDGPRLCVATPGLQLADAEQLLRIRLGEMERRAAYTFALVDTDETAILGELRVAPPTTSDGGPPHAVDAEVTWWIVPECEGTDLAHALDVLVPHWVERSWPFTTPRLCGPGS
ncbi:hypothetical protein [Nocardioides sp.]|uniref:hypothetical protein n=1 Tax=Nocardioides sp. TaxID=35761 RepID=UPI002ED2755D